MSKELLVELRWKRQVYRIFKFSSFSSMAIPVYSQHSSEMIENIIYS